MCVSNCRNGVYIKLRDCYVCIEFWEWDVYEIVQMTCVLNCGNSAYVP